MASWSEGYFTDVEYTDHYFKELNPLWLNLNLTLAGLEIPGLGRNKNGDICPLDNFSYLELAFGQGRSINIHAHTTNGNFVGTDFNPAQVYFAKDCQCADNVVLYDDSFKELLERFEREKPQFDYIVFHGLFSWISAENRAVILEIVRRFLKVGGVVYNSYNCAPGWSPKLPSRAILKLYNDSYRSAEMNAQTLVKQGLSFLGEFINTNPSFMVNNPHNKALFESLQKLDPSYIAHEYLNKDWECFYFYEVAKAFEEAKCSFAASADVLDHFNELNLSQEAVAFLTKIQNRVLKEQLRDYYVSRQFRKDIFIKGGKRITPQQVRKRISNTSFVAVRLGSEFSGKVQCPLGEANLQKEPYDNVLKFLAEENYRPKIFQEIAQSCKLDFPILLQILMVLAHQNFIHPTQELTEDIKQSARAYNQNLFSQQIQGNSSGYVAAPRIASCVCVSNLEQIAMYGYLQNVRKESELTSWTIKIMKDNGQGFLRDGKLIENDSEVKEEVKKIIKGLLERLPIYKALGILD